MKLWFGFMPSRSPRPIVPLPGIGPVEVPGVDRHAGGVGRAGDDFRVVAVGINNPGCSPFQIQRRNASPTPAGFAEIVSSLLIGPGHSRRRFRFASRSPRDGLVATSPSAYLL